MHAAMGEEGGGEEQHQLQQKQDDAPLSQRIFCAARDGMAITMHNLLEECGEQEQVSLLSELNDDDDRQRATPLLIAAKNGHEKVVSMLLDMFAARGLLDVGQTGCVRFGGYLIKGAGPLWCAAGAGHLRVVAMLVGAGADVNQATKINSTPLRAACFEGHLEVVRYLLEHGASPDISNHFNNTCLMIAAYKGHLDVVKFLLEKGVNPNLAANCGATAMHFSAEAGHVGVVEALLDGGAKMTRSAHGVTPLLAAAERCQREVVEYIISRPELSRRDRIDALELLGASLANDKDSYAPAAARAYLSRGMEERWREGEEPVPKPKERTLVEAYGNRQECETVEEVSSLEDDLNSLHMEGLAIRERLLGPTNPEVAHPIVFRGAVFADAAAFDRCVALWRHALALRRRGGYAVSKDLLRFAQVFSQILHVGLSLRFEDLLETMTAAAEEIRTNQRELEEMLEDKKKKKDLPTHSDGPFPAPAVDRESLEGDLGDNIHTFLYVVVIYTKVKDDLDEEQRFKAMKVLYEVCSVLSPREPRTGRTLLHLAVDSDTPVDDFHTSDVVGRFPSAPAVRALLDAGADPGARCASRGDTPLHRIVAYQRIVSDFTTIHAIIHDLVEAGAHVDVVNSAGLTPMQCATTGVAEIILKSQAKMSLKCLAAQSVRRHGVTYQGQVPKALENFIELHGP